MSEQEHYYQGRQSALQVFHEFTGGVGGEQQHHEDDEEEEVEQETEDDDEKKLCNQKVCWNCNNVLIWFCCSTGF